LLFDGLRGQGDTPAPKPERNTIDHSAPFALQKAIWLEDKLPWVVIGESIPSFPKTPKTG
jgi:hypothetical protein